MERTEKTWGEEEVVFGGRAIFMRISHFSSPPEESGSWFIEDKKGGPTKVCHKVWCLCQKERLDGLVTCLAVGWAIGSQATHLKLTGVVLGTPKRSSAIVLCVLTQKEFSERESYR